MKTWFIRTYYCLLAFGLGVGLLATVYEGSLIVTKSSDLKSLHASVNELRAKKLQLDNQLTTQVSLAEVTAYAQETNFVPIKQANIIQVSTTVASR